MYTIYHNPRCSKSREALSIIEQSGNEKQIKEYLKSPPSPKELKELLSKLNLEPLEIIRKNEPIFKENYQGKEFSREEWIQILAQHPILIERPIVIKGDRAVIGRPVDKVKSLL